MLKGREYQYFEDLEVGFEWESFGRTVTETDVVNFACLSGDFNAIHVDAEYSKDSLFQQRVAHGLLGLSMASGLQCSEKPWAIEAFMGLDWKFSKPIFVGDTIHYKSQIKNTKAIGDGDAGMVKILRQVINQNGECLQEGKWTLLVKKKNI